MPEIETPVIEPRSVPVPDGVFSFGRLLRFVGASTVSEQSLLSIPSSLNGQIRTYRLIPGGGASWFNVGSSRVDLQACKLEYSIVSPK